MQTRGRRRDFVHHFILRVSHDSEGVIVHVNVQQHPWVHHEHLVDVIQVVEVDHGHGKGVASQNPA